MQGLTPIITEVVLMRRFVHIIAFNAGIMNLAIRRNKYSGQVYGITTRHQTAYS